jgi:hypothetical protein
MSDPIQVKDIGIEWADGYANDPSLCLLLDRAPEYGRYDKRPCAKETLSGEQAMIVGSRGRVRREGWHLYWTQDGDFAWFFTWGGEPDDGFCGWKRTITLLDGTTQDIVGGWHVGASAASDVGHAACVHVAYRTDYLTNRHTGEKRLGGGTSVFITRQRLEREIARLLPDVEATTGRGGGMTVKWRAQPSKAEHLQAERERIEPIREALKAKYPRDWRRESSQAERDSLKAGVPYSTLGARS